MNLTQCRRWAAGLFGAVLAAGLVACGGGGGSGGTPTTGSGSGVGGNTPTPTITVGFTDAAGAATTSVSTTGGTVATALVRDSSGAIVANRLVTFASDPTLVTISPPTALTNAAGVASVGIAPASLTAVGAGTVTATATVGTATATGTADFRLAASNVQLQGLDIGSGALAAFGTRAVSVKVLVNGAVSATPSLVTFTASCGAISPASVTTNSQGVAAATYQASVANCSGTTVSINASVAGAASATAQLVVLPSVATNLQFVSSAPQVIYLAGSGGTTQSIVTFKLIDSNASPLQNQQIQLSLANAAPGVSLGTVGNTSAVTVGSDAAGQVSIPVFSGTVPTSLQIKAVLVSNAAVSTTSNTLTVASGVAVQTKTSLSAVSLAMEALRTDGVTNGITVSVSDRQGNPVPDGTQINLTTEGGVLIPPTCITAGGTSSCSVQLRSQGTRPLNGRISVLAYLPGEEDFIDANGNNIYDAGEAFTDLGNAYRDDNENGTYDTGEFVVPRSGSVACAGGVNGRAGTCDGVWGPADVRQQTVIAFSGSTPGSALNYTVGTPTTTTRFVSMVIADENGNSMPTGTTISAAATRTTTVCKPTVSRDTVPNSPNSFTLVVGFPMATGTTPVDGCVSGEPFTVTVKTPGNSAVASTSTTFSPTATATFTVP